MDAIPANSLLRYPLPGPQYTSYPSAIAFRESFRSEDLIQELRIASQGDGPLSLYVQLPSCWRRDGSHPLIEGAIPGKELALTYLHGLDVEIALVAEALDERRRVGRLHLDGGTCSFLDEEDLEHLWASLTLHLQMDPDCELALEVHPGRISRGQLELLHGLGFHRLRVELAEAGPSSSGRPQSGASIAEQLQMCRDLGYDSIQVNLLYGTPNQSVASLSGILQDVLALRPERIALQAYQTRKQDRRLGVNPGAGAVTLLGRELQMLTCERLAQAGYQPVGADHYVLPGDELSLALQQGRLHRGLMGYSAGPADLIGLGMGAVGQVQGAYSQNTRRLDEYLSTLADGRLPVARGYVKDAEDEMRGEVIQSLLCLMQVDLAAVAASHGTGVQAFGRELELLRRLENDGLVRVHGARVQVTDTGRLAAGAIAMVFDHHIPRSLPVQGVPAGV